MSKAPRPMTHQSGVHRKTILGSPTEAVIDFSGLETFFSDLKLAFKKTTTSVVPQRLFRRFTPVRRKKPELRIKETLNPQVDLATRIMNQT